LQLRSYAILRLLIALYTLAFISTSLLFLAPLLVTLAGNPFFGKLSDRTTSPNAAWSPVSWVSVCPSRR
jgi:hypothetical protein